MTSSTTTAPRVPVRAGPDQEIGVGTDTDDHQDQVNIPTEQLLLAVTSVHMQPRGGARTVALDPGDRRVTRWLGGIHAKAAEQTRLAGPPGRQRTEPSTYDLPSPTAKISATSAIYNGIRSISYNDRGRWISNKYPSDKKPAVQSSGGGSSSGGGISSAFEVSDEVADAKLTSKIASLGYAVTAITRQSTDTARPSLPRLTEPSS